MSIRIERPRPDSDNEEDEDAATRHSKLTPTQIISNACHALMDPAADRSQRLEVCQKLQRISSNVDSYLTFSGISQARGPPIDWSLFRKAYSVMMWIKPNLHLSWSSNDGNGSTSQSQLAYDRSPSIERCLYRFATEPTKDINNSNNCNSSFTSMTQQQYKSVGVVVHTSPWVLVEEDDDAAPSTNAPLIVETILTAITLPCLETVTNSNMSTTRRVSYPLRLTANKWHLVCCSHVCPYLKRPQWSVAVDGHQVFTTELDYPTIGTAAKLSTNSDATMMQDNVFLQNIAAGGILCSDDDNDDAAAASASNLQASFSNFDDSFKGVPTIIRPFSVDVSGLAIYPDAVSPNVQAVVAASTQGCCQTSFGMIPCIPPVANWSKGSSASEGLPKVGIPLMVHATSLEIQKLSDHLVFGVSANDGYVVGHDGRTLPSSNSTDKDGDGESDDHLSILRQQPHQRIIVTMSLQPGSMSDAPRVGLVQPGQPVRIDKDDMPSMYVTGCCTLTRSMDCFRDEFGCELEDGAITNMAPWSVALQDQGILPATVLPFFMALSPPGKLFGTQENLYLDSIRQLHALYSDEGLYAAQLIHLLSSFIETGGARVQEEVLQSGCIHILASSLRLSLIRANRVNFFSSSVQQQPKDLEDVARRLKRVDDEGTYEARITSPVSPRHVPRLIVEACARLIGVCCGPAASNIEALSPADRVVRTSDLGLTIVFAFALDFDLWGGDVAAGAAIYKAIADRYGDFCITYGYIIRSQISVQYLLDAIRVQYENQPSVPGLEEVGLQLCRLLTAMLLASLSNRRSVSQAEHDVAACVRALTGASLGSLMAHIVLNAMVAVLVFCDVLPSEVATFFTSHSTSEEHKMQVAARMGRNVLMSEFLDVVGPVLLSRTVFAGDNMQSTKASAVVQSDDHSLSIYWQDHWRLSLLLFSWIASIAGAEGLAAATTTGRLLTASGYAGSLVGAMDGVKNDFLSALYLPSPAVAHIIGYALRSDWNYHEMLSDRLQVLVPLLPGTVIALLPGLTDESSDAARQSLGTLGNLIITVGAAFQRVFGNIHVSAGIQADSRDGTSEIIKSVKSLVPHLVLVALLLENLAKMKASEESSSDVLLEVRSPNESSGSYRTDQGVDDSYLLFKDVIASLPSGDSALSAESIVSALRSCCASVLMTASSLINVSFSFGGAGAAHSLWNGVVTNMEESIMHCSNGGRDADERFRTGCKEAALKVLCDLTCLVFKRSLRRHDQWDLWTYEQSSAVSTICMKLDEARLLRRSLDASGFFNDHQLSLLLAVLEMMAYGRDVTGWCQLALPVMTTSTETGFTHQPLTASKLMLPVLRICTEIVFHSLGLIDPDRKVQLLETQNTEPSGEKDTEKPPRVESVLRLMLMELDLTLTAAIVGLSFPAACDMALRAMAGLRKAIRIQSPEAAKLSYALYARIVEELTARFQSERQLKDRAVVEAHEAQNAIDDSEAVERLILGNVLGLDPTLGNAAVAVYGRSAIRPEEFNAALEQFAVRNGGTDDVQVASDLSLQALIDAWEDGQQAEEEQKPGLFESNQHLIDTSSSEPGIIGRSLPFIGSETAADVVSSFFEFAASEKSRMDEIANRFLPSQRYNRLSYTERWCWARHMEMATDAVWERGVPDGNRDVRSRIPTVPCFPEFRAFIPSFLDHYAEKAESTEIVDPLMTDKRKSLLTDMDTLTKNLLEAGTLAIVDITKTEIADDGDDLEPGLTEQSATAHDSALGDEDAEYLPSGESMDSEDAFGPTSPSADSQTRSAESTFGTGGPVPSLSLITNSAFSTPPDNSSSSMHLVHSNAAGIDHHMDNCLQVRAEGSRACSLLLTGSHLILEYEAEHQGYYEGEFLAAREDAQREQILKDAGEYNEDDPEEQFQRRVDRKRQEIARMRPQSIRWNLSEVSHVYLRRYRLRDSSLEIFFIPSGGASFGGMGMFSASSSLFLDFGPGRSGMTRRDDMAFSIMQRSPPQAVKQWPDRSAQFLHDQLNRLTLGWAEGRITNFDYLLHLNMLSGRSYNDICQYPVFPWVLSDYTSENVPDLSDPRNFRDLSKPMGALNAQRLADFQERFESFVDPSIPPFMYGSHYSTSAGVVLHFLVRLHPFAGLHRQLQSGHFDVADRLFSSVPRTWSMCTGTSAAEVKELTPEWYCNPEFLRNGNDFKLGTSQDGDVLGDVVLPPWAEGSPEKFVEVMRAALESDICSRMLPHWIDLIFGRKQQGSEAIKANNVFFYLTYYGSVDVASIQDESLRQATELQIAHFGQCPMQLFRRHHISRFPIDRRNLTFYQCISSYSSAPSQSKDASYQASVVDGAPLASGIRPFSGSPISYWVHLDAPPPGPHGALISVRFAGTDRCLAVDDKGIFHTFRWAWRAEEQIELADGENGCFIAQRELPRFRSVPRLMHVARDGRSPAVAISKTLFAGRSVLLVLSDGDGRGGLGMQLVDPAKGSIRGEVLIPGAHSSEITCITTDPIGTAAGHGGVGGELALVGSADGCASLWRFMSSHYLPLRPRARFSGHKGAKISAVALNSTTQLAATVSSNVFCLHSIGNGNLIRCFGPPDESVSIAEDSALSVITRFADTPAMAISSQGFLVAVCESIIEYTTLTRTVTTLNLFSIEGRFLGSRPMERWRGTPHRMLATPDGTAVLVCSGRGVTVHRLSCCEPLEILDEWIVTESEDMSGPDSVDHCFDIDLGPSLNRPVAAAAACSNGVLRLHALPGISQWSERHKKTGLGSTMGNAFVKPAQTVNRALKEGLSFGSRIAGMGREIGKEVSTDVKTAGVSGFLGNLMKRRNNTTANTSATSAATGSS